MMDHDPVAYLNVLDLRAQRDNLAARLMSHRHELGQVSALAPGGAVGPKVASAESGSAHFDKDFRSPGFRLGELSDFQLPIADEYDPLHGILLSIDQVVEAAVV
jgi:hypothetical protein